MTFTTTITPPATTPATAPVRRATLRQRGPGAEPSRRAGWTGRPRWRRFLWGPAVAAIGAASLFGIVAANSTAVAAPADGEVVNPHLPSVSADGVHAAFIASNHSGDSTVVYANLDTGTTIDLATAPDSRRTGDTAAATISGDGCVVVAISQIGFDIFRDDDVGDRWDVYRLILPHCGGRENDWRLVSAGADGTAMDGVSPSHRPAVSDDGTQVAFVHDADVDGLELSTIAVVDTVEKIGSAERTTQVPGFPSDSPTKALHYVGADQPTMSADGQRVGFRADFNPTTSEWLGGPEQGSWAAAQVYVWERVDGTVHLVSANDGVGATHGAREPVLSSDGSTVAFVSTGDGFSTLDCETVCADQVFSSKVGDTSPPSLVSVPVWGAAELGGNANSRDPAINVDGSVIAFITDATNLTTTNPGGGGLPNDGDLVIATRDGLRAGIGADAESPDTSSRVPGVHNHPTMSSTGGVILFDTAGTDLAEANHIDLESVSRLDTTETGADETSADPATSDSQPAGEHADPAPPASTDPEAVGGNTTPSGHESATTAPLPDEGIAPAPASGDAGDAVADEESFGSPRQLGVIRMLPRLEVADIDFGTVQTGRESAEFYASVTNRGPTPFVPTEVSTGSDRFTITGGTCRFEIVVPVGGACTVRLTYTPTSQSETADLNVRGRSGAVATARLVGQAGSPQLRIDPAGSDLGTTDVGTTGSTTLLTVTNVDLAAVSMEAARLDGKHPDDFAIIADKCAGTTLGPAEECTVEVSFTPTAPDGRTASVIASTSDVGYTSAVVAGIGTITPSIDVANGPYNEGDSVVVHAHGLRPGSDVWASLVGERELVGPFTVEGDGSVELRITVPSGRRSTGGTRASVAVSSGDTLLTAPIDVEVEATTPSYLPGYGVGFPTS